jgi:hypothetical protein
MNIKALFLLAIVALASTQVVKVVVDDFAVDTNTLLILIEANATLPQTVTGGTVDSGILGG